MTTAELMVKMTLDGAGVKRGADGAVSQFKRVGDSAKNFLSSAIGAGAIAALGRTVLEKASRITDLGVALDINVEKLQAWEFAVGQSGGSLEDIAKTLTRLKVTMAEALGGDGKSQNALARLGASMQDIKTLKAEDVFEKIAAHIGSVDDSAQLTKDTLDVLGKSSVKLTAAFRNGFSEAADQARELGQVLSEDVVKSLDDAGDRFTIIFGQIISGFAPVVSFLSKVVTLMVAGVSGIGAAIGSLSVDMSLEKALAAGGKAADEILMASAPKPRAKKTGVHAADTEKADKEAAKAAEKIKTEEEKDRLKEVEAGRKLGQMPGADSLTRIGLFSGPVNQLRAIADRQLNALNRIDRQLVKLNTQFTFSDP